MTKVINFPRGQRKRRKGIRKARKLNRKPKLEKAEIENAVGKAFKNAETLKAREKISGHLKKKLRIRRNSRLMKVFEETESQYFINKCRKKIEENFKWFCKTMAKERTERIDVKKVFETISNKSSGSNRLIKYFADEMCLVFPLYKNEIIKMVRDFLKRK